MSSRDAACAGAVFAYDEQKRWEVAVATIQDFEKLDIRTGTIIACDLFPEARKPAYKLTIDFGTEIGIRHSSAQIMALYAPEQLVGRQVLGVVNFPSRLVAGFASEVLVLGVYAPEGVVLIAADRPVPNGLKLG
jgi:tRNA-binding protein